MSLTMAAQENTSKIQQEGQYETNHDVGEGVVLDRNGSFGGNGGLNNLDQNAIQKKNSSNASALRQEIAFEGTFKPKTILNNNLP